MTVVPAAMSPPAGRTLPPDGTGIRTEISSGVRPPIPRSPSSVSSNGTTASAPSGRGAPVMMRMAAPCFTLCEGTSPAAMEPMTFSVTGASG